MNGRSIIILIVNTAYSIFTIFCFKIFMDQFNGYTALAETISLDSLPSLNLFGIGVSILGMASIGFTLYCNWMGFKNRNTNYLMILPATNVLVGVILAWFLEMSIINLLTSVYGIFLIITLIANIVGAMEQDKINQKMRYKFVK